jgi:outer membrane protein OmpA-like peptidoglycan-associated protein
MKDYPSLKVEISAHTDDIGSERYNQILSEKRAQSVVSYMKENEIETDRLVAKGYGELKPKFDNDSDENRAKNRRVELKILDINLEE